MRWLRRLGQDLVEGRNLEAYLTIVIALTLGLLGAFSIIQAQVVIAVILATLGLLALSTINSRGQIGGLHAQIAALSALVEQKVLGRARADDFFLAGKPDYEAKFQSADSIYIVGCTLSRTVREYLGAFEARLREGAQLRFAVMDSTDVVTEQATLRSFGDPTPSLYHNRIKPTVDLLCILASLPELTGSIELRMLPFPPAFGLVLIDPDQADGTIYVEISSHRTLAQPRLRTRRSPGQQVVSGLPPPVPDSVGQRPRGKAKRRLRPHR